MPPGYVTSRSFPHHNMREIPDIDGRDMGMAGRAAGELAEYMKKCGKIYGEGRKQFEVNCYFLSRPKMAKNQEKTGPRWDECVAKTGKRGKMPEIISPTYPCSTPALPLSIPCSDHANPLTSSCQPGILPHHLCIIPHCRYFFCTKPPDFCLFSH